LPTLAHAAAPADTHDLPPLAPPGREKQPRGLWLLFMVEMWERFSYYGMRGILVLYLVNSLQWTGAEASRLYGTYTALAYLTPIAGGWLADRVIGTRRSLLVGGIVIALGHFCLAIPGMATFYAGLGLVIVGTGFFKPNVSTMVGQLYRERDPRRDAGFTIFYMGINTGSFLAPLVCGWLADRVGWHYGFGAAGVGMVLGLAVYVWGRDRWLPGVGLPRGRADEGRSKTRAPLTRAEKEQVAAIFVTAFFVVFFWAAFEQAGASLSLFADRHTDRVVGGFTIPTSWFQAVNPLAILLFAPLFAMAWPRMAARGREPSTPVKMGTGLLLLAAGYVFMVVAGGQADRGVLVSPWWLVVMYVLHTWGELCLSPVGLSLVTRLAPLQLASLLMGVWFLANFAANWIAGQASALMDTFPSLRAFFAMFVISSAAAGLVLLAIAPFMRRLMHGRG
jgi:POT family proton-dependent oligopeptide transporter